MHKISFALVLTLTISLKSLGQTFKLVEIASGLRKPVDITSTMNPGDKRLFITEKDGTIKIIDADRKVLAEPFLNIDAKVNSSASERGLLGLVFHPSNASNRYFYVHYNNSSGHTVIARYTVDSLNPNKAVPTSEKVILTINQPFANHNGGDLNFGPDGYLYIGMGDGGSGGDPGNRSQNPKDLLGKMLRIDVNTETEKYTIPADNPFAGQTDTLPEIWSIGWRNPWRFSFDRATGDMWVGDVGQDVWEEISMQPAGKGGLNYGWRCYEGKETFNTGGCQSSGIYSQPVHVYLNKFDVGCSVTGGYVYRGTKFPDLIGKYVYVDYCTGRWWSLSKNTDGTYKNTDLANLEEENYSSLGEDVDGELYVSGLATGGIYHIQSGPSSVSDPKEPSIDLLIAPNPAQSVLHWTIDGLSATNRLSYQIMSSSGQIMDEWQSDYTIQNQHNIANLPSGEYVLLLKGQPLVAKFFSKF